MPLFVVARRHEDGGCPLADAGCECFDPGTAVDVDELTPSELVHFSSFGTAEQRTEIAIWMLPDPAEREAGLRDAEPALELA